MSSTPTPMPDVMPDSALAEMLRHDRDIPDVSDAVRARLRQKVGLQIALRSEPLTAPDQATVETQTPQGSMPAVASRWVFGTVGALLGATAMWGWIQYGAENNANQRVPNAASLNAASLNAAAPVEISVPNLANTQPQLRQPPARAATHDDPQGEQILPTQTGHERESAPASTMATTAVPGSASNAIPTDHSDSNLHAELRMIEAARSALNRQDANGAVQLLREHEQRFVSGALAEDREYLLILALHRGGQREATIARAEDFLQRFATSHYRTRVEAMVPTWRSQPSMPQE